MPTAEAVGAVDQLTLEDVSDYGVIACFVVLVPLFTLLLYALVCELELLVRRLGSHTIQLVMHPIQQKPHELLRVLLAIPCELRSTTTRPGNSSLDRRRGDAGPACAPALLHQVMVTLSDATGSDF